METTLQRAIAQLEQASSGSMAIYRGQLATVLAAARQAGDLAQENYELRQARPVMASDEQLALIEQRHAAYLAGVTTEKEANEDYEYAIPVLVGRVRKADETTDTYAKLLQEKGALSHA